MNRNDFMAYFRDENKLDELSVDDRIEIFKTILLGSSDISKELLEEVLIDYCVGNLSIIKH